MDTLYTLPRCKHASICGGCARQHISYHSQLQEKEGQIASLFAPYLDKGAKLHPIIACDSPWEYRNKMEYSFSQDKKGQQFLGLIMRKTRGHVFSLEECHLTSPWFAQVLQSVRAWWQASGLAAYRPHKDEGSLRTLTLREATATGQRLALLTVSGNPQFALKKHHLDSFVAAIKQIPGVYSIFLCVQQIAKGRPTQFFEMHLDGPDHIEEKIPLAGKEFRFKISPTSFFQPNSRQAVHLYRRALEMADLSPDAHVLDLYAGTAPFGLIFASKAKKVTAIESNPHAVFDAKENCAWNQIENLEAFCGDVPTLLEEMELKCPEVVVIDPPRSGILAKGVASLLALKPQKILYVSCNPNTQIQDCEGIVAGGYRLAEIQPVDQFPHTPHIENIVLLKHVFT